MMARLLVLLVLTSPAVAQVFLNPGAGMSAYQAINKALGGTAHETPDCSHASFGPHITELGDQELHKIVFAFHLHVTPDNDRCKAYDRQRTEIKTYGPSPDYLKSFDGDTVGFAWKFRLDEHFQPSRRFTHIHQIKAGDGDEAAPVITITPRADEGEILQVLHVDSGHKTTVLESTPLASGSRAANLWVSGQRRGVFDRVDRC